MARVNVLETITYGRVSYLCSLQASDTHILGSTLWATTPSIEVVAGLLVGASQYNCSTNPCIVDDTNLNPKIWYAGIVDDFQIPITWTVEHACKVQKQGKALKYYEWPIVPNTMYIGDPPAVKDHLLHWTPNSMAAACMRRKALDFLVGQLGISVEKKSWEALVDLRNDPLLKPTKNKQE